MALEPLRGRRPVNILDVGPAMVQTLAFFSSFECRLHVADMLDSSIVAHQHQLDQKALTARFAEALFMVEAPLDICLLWDFPNHLAPPAASAFNSVLRRFVKPGAWAHGFCSVKRTRPTMRHRHAILKPDQILRREDTSIPPAAYPYSQKQLLEALGIFSFERGALRSEGRVEVVLRAGPKRPARESLLGPI